MFWIQPPAQGKDTSEKDDSTKGDQTRMKRRQPRCLAKVDQSVKNCNDVVNAENKGI
jgi:hypothetical protein